MSDYEYITRYGDPYNNYDRGEMMDWYNQEMYDDDDEMEEEDERKANEMIDKMIRRGEMKSVLESLGMVDSDSSYGPYGPYGGPHGPYGPYGPHGPHGPHGPYGGPHNSYDDDYWNNKRINELDRRMRKLKIHSKPKPKPKRKRRN